LFEDLPKETVGRVRAVLI